MKNHMILLLFLIIAAQTCSVPFCDKCAKNDTTTCVKCNNQYTKQNGSCCNNDLGGCTSCWNNSQLCDSCDSAEYYYGTGQCRKCSNLMDGCLECANDTVCTLCENDQYLLVNDTCENCSSLMYACLECNSMTNCIKCWSSYYLNATSDCQKCTEVYPFCWDCNLTQCQRCFQPQYALNDSDQCQLCSEIMSHCVECYNDGDICTKCESQLYAINATSNLCQSCSDFMWACEQCFSQTICGICTSDPTITLSSSTKQCANCSQLMPNCMQCTSDSQCDSCSVGYIKSVGDNSTSCAACWQVMFGCQNCTSAYSCTGCYVGYLVDYGCALVPGCVAVFLGDPSISRCIKCDGIEFHTDPVDGVCQCISGYLAQSICTDIFGCTSAERRNGTDHCLECNTSALFQAVDGGCQCVQYYQRSGNKCFEVCGDGFLIGYECDDGNLVNGDGCSSTCQVQSDYICFNQLGLSSCAYNNKATMTLQSIYRQGKDNRIVISLALEPNVQIFERSNLNDSIFLDIDVNHTMKYYVTGSTLSIQLTYFSQIQGLPANFTIVYDENVIRNPPQTVLFEVWDSSGASLAYQDQQWFYESAVKILSTILGVGVVLLLLGGSWAHKMVGVEVIFTFQVTRVIQVFALNYDPNMEYFQGLNICLGVLKLFGSGTTAPQHLQYARMQLDTDFIYSCQLSLIILILVVLIDGLVVIVYTANQPDIEQTQPSQKQKKKKEQHPKEHLIFRLRRSSFDALIFPTSIAFILLTLTCLCVNGSDSLSKTISSLVETLLMLFVSFLIAIVGSEPISLCLSKNEQLTLDAGKLKCNRFYPGIFVTNVGVFAILTNLAIYQLLPRSSVILGGYVTIFCFIFIFYRPYDGYLHNLGLIVNQISILFTLVWIVLDHRGIIEDSVGKNLVFGQIALLFLVLTVGLIRVIHTVVTTQQTNHEQKTVKKRSRQYRYKTKDLNREFNEGLICSKISQEQQSFYRSKLVRQKYNELVARPKQSSFFQQRVL